MTSGLALGRLGNVLIVLSKKKTWFELRSDYAAVLGFVYGEVCLGRGLVIVWESSWAVSQCTSGDSVGRRKPPVNLTGTQVFCQGGVPVSNSSGDVCTVDPLPYISWVAPDMLPTYSVLTYTCTVAEIDLFRLLHQPWKIFVVIDSMTTVT